MCETCAADKGSMGSGSSDPTPKQTKTALLSLALAPREVEVLEKSGEHALIRCDERIESGALVRLDIGKLVLLGESVCCKADRDGWLCSLHLEHSVVCSADLRRLSARLKSFTSMEFLPDSELHGSKR